MALRAAMVAGALVAAPSLARAQVVFGGDLNRPVNYRFDCGAAPGVGPFGEPFIYPTNFPTCTWVSLGRSFGQAEGFLVPNGVGTITSVRVKVGPITGPMQVIVLRAIRGLPDPMDEGGPGGAVCCAEVGRSAVFRPAPNAISTIVMNLPVKADIFPNPISNAVEFDGLALSVLAPGVPIPVHDTGNYQDISGPVGFIYFPAVQPGQERYDSPFSTLGYQVLMEATWVPVQGGGPPGGGTVALVQPVATVQQNFLLLGLRCTQATPCIGVLRVQNQGAVAGDVTAERGRSARVKRARVKTVAKADFNIPTGGTQQVMARMTRRGRRLVRKKTPPPLYANLEIGGQQVPAGAIQLVH